MPWFFSNWWRPGKKRRTNQPMPTKPMFKRACLELERLEKRWLFSANVWLQQQLTPLGGVGQLNPSNALFHPVLATLEHQFDLQSGSVTLSGSFTFSDTGS